MSLNHYKESIKNLVDSTNDELLLKTWKQQLEWDVEHQNELLLSQEELMLVQEGEEDYKSGNVISLEEFIGKRR